MSAKSRFYGKTKVIVCASNSDLGERSAEAVAKEICRQLEEKENLRIVFAAGESQSSFHRALTLRKDIEWQRITAFNIDDFWHPDLPAKFTCGYQTTQELYAIVKPREYHLVAYNATDPEAECRRFEELLRKIPIDILCQGIGTSGHLALNEPGQTDFNDSRWVRLVDVAEQSKKQLIEDPNFKDLGYIPEKGITMTIPAILSATSVFTMVPLRLKKNILTKLSGTMSPTESLPASVLLEKEGLLFVDSDSCPEKWK